LSWAGLVGLRNDLKVFENRVVRGLLGLQKEEVATEWRRLHNEELH
jgi:hypothetical protein